ncbi:MAG: histidine kinase [Lachnospiraceae bacterium]|nr:histidine kinase [Lachnospiraceae bacterium]
MINKSLLFFNNLPFRKKILIICIFISLIPMILFGIVSYVQISSQMLKREENNLNETLRQAADSIDYKLNSYMDALNIVLWNDTLKSSLQKNYDNNYEQYMFYKEEVDPLFLTIRSLNTDIETITLYTSAPSLHPHGDYVLKLESAEDSSWYEHALNATRPFFQVSEDGKTLNLVCRMYYSYPAPISIVCIAVNMDALFASTQNLVDGSYCFLLTDANNEPVYMTYSFLENASYRSVSTEELLAGEIPSDYVATQYRLNDGIWTAWLYRPSNEQLTAYRHFQLTAVLLALLCIIISFLIASYLSQIMAHPLEKLSADILLVEQGQYEVVTDHTDGDFRQDEVGHLQHAFRAMVIQLNHLINEVLIAQIEQQKYELRILQAQINPHFLYNSLSLINVQAIMAGQMGISQMSQLLSTFYRTMLNKGKSMTTIRDELENTKAYVTIQQIMHSYSFDVTYDIDEQVLYFSVLNLIIQPLAENAILHGLDHRQAPGKGMLTISCRLENNFIVFHIIDNGCGMSEKDSEAILMADSKGYGVQNVHRRIQLYYGKECGLQYRSTPGAGTCAILRLAQVQPS